MSVIGRVGCFLAGCCYGRPYDGIFAVYYPNAITNLSPTQGYFPVQLVEAAWNIVIFLWLLHYKKKAQKTFDILSMYLCLYAVGRFILEIFRNDTARGIYFGVSVSQWINLGLLAAYVIRSFLLYKRKGHVLPTSHDV